MSALACASRPAVEAPVPAPAEAKVAAAVAEEAPPIAAPALQELGRGRHRAPITEVILDPRGEAAITLDSDGGARLWPTIRAERQEAPVILPFVEAAWITLARADADRLVIAWIDTAGAARVGEVVLAAEGPRWRPLFDMPATDPHLELHVLDGGERLLALALDHRIRLLDRQGTARALIDTPSFIPWQLRLAHQAAGPPKVVVVLAGPVRVQPLVIDGDTLTVTGEARRVDLDRGPNRNDVILAPDGAYVTSLRRPKAKGRAWSLELIDLASDQRRWIAGDIDATVRPRLLLLDAERALLDGGTGEGHIVDLKAAIAAPPGTVVDRRKVAKTPTKKIRLPGSTEDSRMLGDFAGGLRVFADGDALYVDAIDSDEHLRARPRPFDARAVALDPAGERLAWLIRGGVIMTEVVGDEAPPRALADPRTGASELAFVDRDHLIVGADTGEVRLLRWDDGALVDQAKVPARWGVSRMIYHREAEGRGALGLVLPRQDAAIMVEVADGRLAAPRPFTGDQGDRWADLGVWSPAERTARARLGAAARSRALVVGDRTYFTALGEPRRVHALVGGVDSAFTIEGDAIRGLVAAGPRLAILEASNGGVTTTVTVVDVDGDGGPRRLWSREYSGVTPDLAFTGDGARLAIAGEGGRLVDAATGAVIVEHVDLGIEVERRRDDAPGITAP